MRVWITKYALTEGIIETEARRCEGQGIRPGQMIELESTRYEPCGAYYHRPEWHETRRGAVERAEQMRQKKIASLRKQLAKLEAKTDWAEELNQ
jgi:hypothetical protein